MIATHSRPTAESRGPRAVRGFTLTELLVAMAIIVVIAGITAVGVRTLARDAKLASATNTVIAGLDTARGIAIRDNRLTMLVFRPRLDGNRQYVELVVAQWTGESPAIQVQGMNSPQGIDRFAPVQGVNVRRLPQGINIAGPFYGNNQDDTWITSTNFRAPSEAHGRMLAVMFAGDGTVVLRNAATDSHRMFVDFNRDGMQQVLGPPANQIDYNNMAGPLPSGVYGGLFQHYHPDGEPYVSMAPFLAIFDDDRCRAEYDTSEWTDEDVRIEEYTQYITNHADRIHFNRYTGVVMR